AFVWEPFDYRVHVSSHLFDIVFDVVIHQNDSVETPVTIRKVTATISTARCKAQCIPFGFLEANVFNVRFAGNSVGITAKAGVARIIGNAFFSNSTGINPAGGSICSTGNNRFAGNSKNGSPSVNTGACLITVSGAGSRDWGAAGHRSRAD